MNKCLFLLLILISPLFTSGQESVRVVALGEIVEIIAEPREENADFVTVEIKVKQKIIKRFSASSVTLPQIVGTFNWIDGNYVIYRTDMGAGMCVRGSIYVLKFHEDQSSGALSAVSVSPELNACLGEYPLFAVNYKGKDKFVLSIAQHELDLDNFNKWVENKPTAKKVKRK